MLNIHITTTADQNQRYDTVGDYTTDENGQLHITVSDMPDARYEFLIAIHELVESYLCKERNISESAIDTFDMSFEEARADGDTTSEPGDDPHAPYHNEHVFATKIEQQLANELGVDWQAYSKACAEKTQN